ncbi:MAG: hypothetical protein ACK4FP_12965 [Azonexus sp.]
MNPLRHFLLVVALILGQLLTGVHAVEHAASREEGLPTHTCPLCLAAHDLGVALPSAASLPPVVLPVWLPDGPTLSGRADWPAPVACQRGPPLA